jgi:integrase
MSALRGESLRWVTHRRTTGRISSTTAVSDRQTMMGFCDAMGNRRLEQIGRRDIERWLTQLQRLSPGTRRNRFSVVKVFFDHHVERGRIRRSPFVGINPPKVPRSRHRALSWDQVSQLLSACPDARARCVIILGVQLGLRRMEIAGLEVGDVDWSTRLVEVTGKGGHTRVVPLTIEAGLAVNSYLTESPTNGGPLVRNDRYPTRGVTPVWVGRLVTRIAFESGIKHAARDGISTHALRHTAATDAYQNSRDVMVVRDMLGHRDLGTTATYVRGLDVERLREAIEGRTYSDVVTPFVQRTRAHSPPSISEAA